MEKRKSLIEGVVLVRNSYCDHGKIIASRWFEDYATGKILDRKDPRVLSAVEADKAQDRVFSTLSNLIGIGKALDVLGG